MVMWLVPICLYWTLAALYLGGAPIRIEGGGAGRQVGGLLLHFVLFLGVWTLARAALTSLLGTTFAVVASVLLAVILLPVLARLAFRLVGVRISSADALQDTGG
jgi:hypothetical protein